MSGTDLVMLIVGIIAFAALIVLIGLYFYWKKKQQEHLSFPSEKKEGLQEEESEAVPAVYTSNAQLDGARVSHRREHADRMREESYWKEKKAHEAEEKEQRHKEESKHDILMIFSPVSGDVKGVYDTKEKAQSAGMSEPGMVIMPNDDKLYAPLSGIIHFGEEEGILSVTNEAGVNVKTVISLPKEEKLCEVLIKDGMIVSAGECIGTLVHGIRQKYAKDLKVMIEASGFEKNKLLLVKKVSFISHGDQIMTLNKL